MALVALAAVAIVLSVTAPNQAQASGGHGVGGGHSGGGFGHPGFSGHSFNGHHFDGHHFTGHHHFDGRVHGRFAFGFFPYYGYYPGYSYDPYYGYYAAPGYWYYCPSSGAYYPDVPTCPESWVPVPAS
jgi:hypothetical protein